MKGEIGGGVGSVGDFEGGSTLSLVEALVPPTPIALSPDDQLILLSPPLQPPPLPATRFRPTVLARLSTSVGDTSSFIDFINESARSALELLASVDPRSAIVASGELKRMSGSDMVVGIGGMRYESPCFTDRHVDGGFEGEADLLTGDDGATVEFVVAGAVLTTLPSESVARYSTIASTSDSDSDGVERELVDVEDLKDGRWRMVLRWRSSGSDEGLEAANWSRRGLTWLASTGDRVNPAHKISLSAQRFGNRVANDATDLLVSSGTASDPARYSPTANS